MWNVFWNFKDNEIVLIAQSWAYQLWLFVQIKAKIKQIEEFYIVKMFYSASGQTTNREGAQPNPLTENWVNDLLSMALPTRARLSFPPKPVPPFRKIEQSSYPHSSESGQKKHELQSHSLQDENHSHWKLTKMITWVTACVAKKCYEPCHAGPHLRWKCRGGEFWQNMVNWEGSGESL